MIRGVMGSRASIGGVLGQGRGSGGNGLLTGLVAYWALDEASGNALDKHSGGLTLTQSDSPGANTGKVYATARRFNGVTNYFYRNTDSYITLGNVDYAVAAWIYLSDLNTRFFMSKADGTVNTDWDYAGAYIAGTGLRWSVGQAAGPAAFYASTFGTLSINTWYLFIAQHVSATKTVSVSVNGGTEDSGTYAGTHATSTRPLTIGRISNYATLFWNGRIGPVAMWKNRTLSAADRSALYNGGAGLAYSAFS